MPDDEGLLARMLRLAADQALTHAGEAERSAQRRLDALRAKLEELNAKRAPFSPEAVERAAAIGSELQHREQRVLRAIELDPPPWARDVLGALPEGLAARQAWRAAVRTVSAYRSEWGVTDETSVLGRTRPDDLEHRRAYDQARCALDSAREQIAGAGTRPGAALTLDERRLPGGPQEQEIA